MSNEEEDLDALLAQADSMISEASAPGIVIDGFAIDSDEEDDDGDKVVDVTLDSPAPKANTANMSNGDALKVPISADEDPLLHPLHEDVVHQPTPPSSGGAPSMVQSIATGGYSNNNMDPNSGTAQVGAGGATMGNLTASVTSAMRNMGVNEQALETQFKAQTSRFAANLSSMAQRVATAAQNVTPTGGAQHAAMTASFEGSLPTMSVHMNYNNANAAVGVSTSPGTMSGPPSMVSSSTSNNNSPYASQSNSAHGMPQPTATSTSPAGPAPMMNFELDHVQQTALVELHVGKLLPGEKVIMFLHNLLHVSDSSGFQYAANSPTAGTTVWCCVMTYYRLILFGTTQEMMVHIMNTVHTGTSPEAAETAAAASKQPGPPLLQHAFTAPSDWNASCWPPAHPTVMEMPLASMAKVDKTVYTASTGGSAVSANAGAQPGMTASPNRTTTLMGLQIWAKEGRWWRFSTASYPETNRVHTTLVPYAFPGRNNLGYLFAFESKRAEVCNSVVEDPVTGQKTVSLALSRKRFDGVAEFQRQFHRTSSSSQPTMNGTADNVSSSPSNATPNPVKPWTVWTRINAQYQLCSSYPSVLAGPASLDDSNPDALRLLQSCAAFRSEQRLPALAWSSGIDGASIWRCSQPKIGLQGNRSPADELVLKHIMEAAKSANALREQPLPVRMDATLMQMFTGSTDLANSHWVKEAHCAMKILDLRPRSAAMANRTGGYGYENTSNYPGTTLQFCDIGNIHAVRGAYQKMTALCLNMTNTQDVNWGSALEDTKWLAMLRVILAAAWETAFWVHVHRLPVLLHCSHGWDRTSQVSALAQLMLDPYYRTMEGFSCLVEKEFCSFGHPFHTRCAHGEGAGGDSKGGAVAAAGSRLGSSTDANNNVLDEGQISPIFLQFLDCVWQMVRQFPECFEFTTDYVLELSIHVYSCRFGNMLCDTERERELTACARQRTYSVWDHLEQDPDAPGSDPKAKLWKNKQYDPSPNAGGGILLMPMPTLLRNITLWREKYARFGPTATERWRNTDQSHLWQPRPTEAKAS